METIGEILKWIGGFSVCCLAWFCAMLVWLARQERKERKADPRDAAILAWSNSEADYLAKQSPAPTTPEPECQSAAPEATTPRVTAPASL